MTLGLGTVAFLIVAWYIARGGIEGRGRLVLFALACGALGFLGTWAARAWQLLGTGVEVAGQVAGAAEATGFMAGVLPWL